MHHLSIDIENFRCFGENTTVKFAPITILTGPNNSGKSSVIKSLLLLKDSLPKYFQRDLLNDKKFNDIPIPAKLDFGNKSKHKLGSFKTVLNSESKKETLSFSIPFLLAELEDCPAGKTQLTFSEKNNKNYLEEARVVLDDELLFGLRNRLEKDGSISRSYNINIGYILRNIEKDNIVTKPGLKKSNWQVVSTGANIDLFKTGSQGLSNSSTETFGTAEYTLAQKRIESQLLFDPNNTLALEKYKGKEFQEILSELKLAEEKILSKIIDDQGFVSVDWSQHAIKPTSIEEIIMRFYEIVLYDLYRSGSLSRKYSLGTSQSHFDFIVGQDKPKSSTIGLDDFGIIISGFYDRLLQFNFTELAQAYQNTYYYPNPDVRFENLISEESGLIYKLLNDFILMRDEDDGFVKKQYPVNNESYRFVLAALQYLEIGDNLQVDQIGDYGFDVSVVKDKQVIRLKDSGFGIRKLVSIILLIASRSNDEASYYIEDGDVEYTPNTIILEEPESNLHPKLQSRLADVVLYAVQNFNSQFIIETHSEYLIRKLQYLTAKEKNLRKGDVLIQYFHDKALHMHPKSIEIEEDGMLSDDFGSGFFDEANNLAIELFNLRRSQSN